MKRVIVLLITFCLCLSMIPAAAFADDGGESGKVCNLLVIGDSTTNGFGMPDHIRQSDTYAPGNSDLEGSWTLEKAQEYNSDPSNVKLGRMSEESYPWKLKKYIESQEGVSKCSLNPLCLDGMMTDSLRAMLDPDYYARSIVYERDLMGEGEGPVDYLITRYSQALYDGNTIPENTYDALHTYTEAEVKKANVIVIDVCMNNVSLYLLKRISSLAGAYYMGGQYYPLQKVSDIDGLSDKNRARLKVLKKEVVDYLGNPENPMTEGIIEAVLYAFADCVTNFSENLRLVRKLNPDAKIIVPGLYNGTMGFKITMDSKEIDIGPMNEYLIKAINSYIRALDDNSPNYYFADTPMRIHSVNDQFQEAESLEEFIASKYGQKYVSLLYETYGNMLCPGSAYLYKNEIQNLFADAIRNYPIDLALFTSGGINMGQIMQEASAYCMTGDQPSANTMVFIHVLSGLLILHPSNIGCEQKYEAVRKAYDKDNTAYEEVLGDVVDAVKAAASKAGINSIDDLKKIAALKDLASLISKEELLKIAQSIYDLPDLEAQIQQYMDEHTGEDAGKTEDRISSLEAQINELTAIIEKLTQEAEKKKSTLAKAKIKTVKPAKKAITVKWKAVANASGYKVYYKTSGKKAVIKTVKGAKKLTLKLTGLKKKAKYTVKVRAYKTASGKTTYGKWSAAKKAKTK